MMRRRRAIAALAGTVGALLIAEGALRARDAWLARRRLAELPPVDARRLVPSDDPELRFALHPRLVDPDGRALVLGDSITCDATEPWTRVLERRGLACRSLAVTGYSLLQSARAAELAPRPDIIIAQLCLNDPYTSETDYGSDAPMPSRLFMALLWRLDRPRARSWFHVERLYDAQGWRNVEAGLDRLAALRVPTLLVLFPSLHEAGYASWGHGELHRGWAERAAARGLPLLDLRAPFDAAGLIEDAPREDIIHPDARGHAVAGEAIARALVERGMIPP
jgi:hypothetical protein